MWISVQRRGPNRDWRDSRDRHHVAPAAKRDKQRLHSNTSSAFYLPVLHPPSLTTPIKYGKLRRFCPALRLKDKCADHEEAHVRVSHTIEDPPIKIDHLTPDSMRHQNPQHGSQEPFSHGLISIQTRIAIQSLCTWWAPHSDAIYDIGAASKPFPSPASVQRDSRVIDLDRHEESFEDKVAPRPCTHSALQLDGSKLHENTYRVSGGCQPKLARERALPTHSTFLSDVIPGAATVQVCGRQNSVRCSHGGGTHNKVLPRPCRSLPQLRTSTPSTSVSETSTTRSSRTVSECLGHRRCNSGAPLADGQQTNGSSTASGSQPSLNAPSSSSLGMANGNSIPIRHTRAPGNRADRTVMQTSNPASQTAAHVDGFPCVWHGFYSMSDPTEHCSRRKQFIAQLEPHHGCHSHNLFYCSVCWERFSTLQAKNDHKKNQCSYRCVTTGCHNYEKAPLYRKPCLHGRKNAPIEKWKKIYRMAHNLAPNDYVPDPNIMITTSTPSPSTHQTLSHHLADSENHPIAGTHFPPSMAFTYGSITLPEPAESPLPQSDSTRHANDQLWQRYQSLQDFAAVLWEYVDSDAPTWEQPDIEMYNVMMQPTFSTGSVVGDQALVGRIRQLEAHVKTLRYVIEKPMSRTPARWKSLRKQAILLAPASSARDSSEQPRWPHPLGGEAMQFTKSAPDGYQRRVHHVAPMPINRMVPTSAFPERTMSQQEASAPSGGTGGFHFPGLIGGDMQGLDSSVRRSPLWSRNEHSYWSDGPSSNSNTQPVQDVWRVPSQMPKAFGISGLVSPDSEHFNGKPSHEMWQQGAYTPRSRAMSDEQSLFSYCTSPLTPQTGMSQFTPPVGTSFAIDHTQFVTHPLQMPMLPGPSDNSFGFITPYEEFPYFNPTDFQDVPANQSGASNASQIGSSEYHCGLSIPSDPTEYSETNQENHADDKDEFCS